ncbi:MAG: hypothetical protein AMXMBFR61_03310 [Fimbriimonadales bacterium]
MKAQRSEEAVLGANCYPISLLAMPAARATTRTASGIHAKDAVNRRQSQDRPTGPEGGAHSSNIQGPSAVPGAEYQENCSMSRVGRAQGSLYEPCLWRYCRNPCWLSRAEAKRVAQRQERGLQLSGWAVTW